MTKSKLEDEQSSTNGSLPLETYIYDFPSLFLLKKLLIEFEISTIGNELPKETKSKILLFNSKAKLMVTTQTYF